MKLLNVLMVLVGILINSCGELDCGKESTVIETRPYYDLKSNFCRVINADSILNKSVDLVISDEASFRKYVECVNPVQQLDFKNESLLIGKIYWPYCAEIFSQSLYIECSNLKLTTVINNGGDGSLCGAETVMYYFLIVENRSNLKNIKYEILSKF